MRGEDVPFFTTASSAITFKTKVGIGAPPTFYTLIVDTGSANTWVSARDSHPFKPTKTSRETGRSLAINYGSGTFHGKLWYDRVTLGGLVIENQGIGVAESAYGFGDDIDGILGLGMPELTRESLVKGDDDEDDELEVIPTVLDNLFAQGKIRQKTIAISFDRMSRTIKSAGYTGTFHGVLTFGGTDSSRYVGDITYVSIPTNRPCSKHWSFEQRVTYGSSPTEPEATEIMKGGTGVIDTGSASVHLELRAFDAYRNATKAEFDFASDILSLPEHRRTILKSLFFEIGGTTFEIPPEEQIWPRELNDVAGGPAENTYLVYVDMVNNNGVDISLINGFTWLQHFYVVLDADNRRIGFAKSAPGPLGVGHSNVEKESALQCSTSGKLSFSMQYNVVKVLIAYISFVFSALSVFSRLPHSSGIPHRLSSLYTQSGKDSEN